MSDERVLKLLAASADYIRHVLRRASAKIRRLEAAGKPINPDVLHVKDRAQYMLDEISKHVTLRTFRPENDDD